MKTRRVYIYDERICFVFKIKTQLQKPTQPRQNREVNNHSPAMRLGHKVNKEHQPGMTRNHVGFTAARKFGLAWENAPRVFLRRESGDLIFQPPKPLYRHYVT